MNLELVTLCLCSAGEHQLLKEKTDSCSAMGRSYELRCSLPPLCSPSEATLGFCRAGSTYMLYIRPRVVYAGCSEALTELFAGGMRSFPSFSSLSERMRQWGSAIREGSDTPRDPAPALLRELQSSLERQVMGQRQATEAAAYRIYTHLCKKDPARPLSLILHGPTGTGKSELAKSIPTSLNALFPSAPFHFVWTDLNSYTEAHSVARLLGAPPGYIGYDDRPVFEIVRQKPRTVFLFDELEKAHSEVLKIFMSILDEGRCTSRKEDSINGRELDFRRCIFLFTTNLDLSGSRSAAIGFAAPAATASPTPPPSSLAQRLLSQDDLARQAMVRSGVLREIAGRFTGFLPFHPLEYSDRAAITAKQIGALGREFGLRIVSVSPELVSALTPQEVFSVRSTVAALEGLLTPLFAQHANSTSSCFHLLGTPDHMKLVADHTKNANA